jgi:CheY-like chemotaxis protein
MNSSEDFDRYLLKPIEPADLIDAVREAADQHKQ